MNGRAPGAGGAGNSRRGAVALVLLVLLAGCGGPALAGESGDARATGDPPAASVDDDAQASDETAGEETTGGETGSKRGSDASASPANATDGRDGVGGRSGVGGRDGVGGPGEAGGRDTLGANGTNTTAGVGDRPNATASGATKAPNSSVVRTPGPGAAGAGVAVGGTGSNSAAGGSGETSVTDGSSGVGAPGGATGAETGGEPATTTATPSSGASPDTTATTASSGLSRTDPRSEPFAGGRPATVVRVLDGDTLRVAFDDGTTATVDLVGVDAPERYEPQRPAAFPGVPATAAGREYLGAWGVAAHDALAATAEGERATLYVAARSNVTRSPASATGGYDEPEPLLVAYVDVDGRRLNRALLADGYARATDTGHSQLAAFRAEADAARSTGRGLWSTNASV